MKSIFKNSKDNNMKTKIKCQNNLLNRKIININQVNDIDINKTYLMLNLRMNNNSGFIINNGFQINNIGYLT